MFFKLKQGNKFKTIDMIQNEVYNIVTLVK